jgi:LysM repeat protein
MTTINNKSAHVHTPFKTWETKATQQNQAKRFEQALDRVDPVSMYTVQAGDNLSHIAARHGVELKQLLKANPQIRNPDLIHQGQQINLPVLDKTVPQAEPVANPQVTPPVNDDLIYGDKVSLEFAQKIVEIAERLGVNPNHLMAVIHFETAGTFSPSIQNPMTRATGLIQFLRGTAQELGTTIDELAEMSAERQLDFVESYLSKYAGRMNNVEDTYMAVFYPIAMGRPSDSVLFSQGSRAYRQNAGLDHNHDNRITKAEATAGIHERIHRGRLASNN